MLEVPVYRTDEVKMKLVDLVSTMQPHQRLPSRVKLCEMFEAARTTIDRAVAELIGAGILVAKDGSGTYVRLSTEPAKAASAVHPDKWGLVIPNILHDTYPGILRGVEDVAHEKRVNVFVCNTDNDTVKQNDKMRSMIEARVHGMIIVPAIIGDPDLSIFHQLREANIPFVFCNRGLGNIAAPKVMPNNFYGAYSAVKHLIESGYRQIAYLSRPPYPTALERYQGYLAALNEFGLQPDPNLAVFEESFTMERHGYDGMKRLLASAHPPDAAFCFNDTIAVGAFEAVREAGFIVGGNFGIIGYDDTSLAMQLPVKLSSVKFGTYEIGTQSAKLLYELTTTSSVDLNSIRVVQPEIVIRQSSLKQLP